KAIDAARAQSPTSIDTAGPDSKLTVASLDRDNSRFPNVIDRLDRCRKGEEVRFMGITAKSFLLPVLQNQETVRSRPGLRAIDKGVNLFGIVLDPNGIE